MATPGTFVEFCRQRGLARGRPLQAVRRRRRRHGLGRGRRHAAGGAAVGRPAQRPSGPGGGAGFGGEPGRCVQRPDRAQRPLAAAGDPAGAGQRRAVAGRGGRGRGARHRHDARRPDRGPGAARHLRPGPARGPAAVARLGQVQHRPHPGRGRCRRRHQDGPGACGTACCPGPCTWTSPPRTSTGRRARSSCSPRHGSGRRPAARAGPGVSVVRHQRHQRPRHPGAGARDGPPSAGRPTPAGPADRAVRGRRPVRCPGCSPHARRALARRRVRLGDVAADIRTGPG